MHFIEMPLPEIVVVGVIIFLGGMVQSVIGFGYALFATPLLLLLGIPLPDIIILVSTSSMLQAGIGVRKLNEEVPWRLSITATAFRLVSLCVGLFFLKKMVDMHVSYIRIMIGVILSLLVTIQLLWRPVPVKKMHYGWDLLAFITSGLIGGTCGMGGPPLVLWAMAHDWSAQKARGFLFAVFVTSIPVQILLMGFMFGFSILWNAVLGMICFPLIYFGTSIAIPIGTRIGMERLRQVTYVVLLIVGINSVVSGFRGG